MTTDREKETAAARNWRRIFRTTKRAAVVSWPQALREARAMTDDQLRAVAQGCIATDCLHHGAVNHVRSERGVLLEKAER